MNRPFLVISGTNRPDSNALRVASVIQAHYDRLNQPARTLSLTELPLELFRPEAYKQKPPGFEALRQEVVESAGLHVVTPEYNGSYPGVLKYFIDHLKFPDSFERKPVAFVGEADGRFGALRSVEQLQTVFTYRYALIYPVRVFIPDVVNEIARHGGTLGPELIERLGRQVEGFVKFATLLAAAD